MKFVLGFMTGVVSTLGGLFVLGMHQNKKESSSSIVLDESVNETLDMVESVNDNTDSSAGDNA